VIVPGPWGERAAKSASPSKEVKFAGGRIGEALTSDTSGQPTTAGWPRDVADWLALKDRALDVAAEGITIADARQPDRPLIYVNQGFERMTGYPVADVLGRNCRFLQGPETDAAAVAEIRAALAAPRECVVEILNYRKDGTTFWNRLSITPLRDAAGEVTHFIGVQSDVTSRRLAEDGLRKAKQALEHDLRLAARVQQALLPPPEFRAGDLRIAHAFHPCDDLAGDGVGVVSLPDNRLGIYLLDVSGHGVGAALLSFTLAHLLSPTLGGSLLTEHDSTGASVVPPCRVAERLNRQFPMDRTRQYFTLVYGVADPSSGRFHYVTAGHPAPVLLTRTGSPTPVAGAGLPVGMIDEATYDDEVLTLQPGDRVYCYTDGAIEALNAAEDEFGVDRLLAEIDRWRGLPLRAGLDRIAAAVRGWSSGPLKDDVSLIAIERTG
jgi:sigma-B regulation protein RsbU (phosphoserine phosphatase)